MAIFDMNVPSLICSNIVPVIVIIGGIYCVRKFSYKHTYKRGFAWIMNILTYFINIGLRKKKIQLFDNMLTYKTTVKHDLDVLEIGVGSAANLEYYPPNTKLTCLEPNPYFDKYVKAKLEQSKNVISAEIVHGCAEDFDMEDENFDVVVCTLVMCSVRDPMTSLQQIKRVLKPGGMLLFLEHVADKGDTFLRKVQGWLNPAWMVVFDGCHIDRDTEWTIRQAGFSSVETRRFRYSSWIIPPTVRPFVFGVAKK